jgi:hypothetical protein
MSNDTRRVHIVMPRELLNRVDREVGPGQRSRFVADALREKLMRLAAERAAGSLAGVDIPGWETAESTDAWVRALREADDRLDRRSHRG